MQDRNPKSLVVFDFDGTITRGDSFLAFLWFANTWYIFLWKSIKLSPIWLGFRVGLISNERAKTRLVQLFFQGCPVEEVKQTAAVFTRDRLQKMPRPAAMKAIQSHQEAGHRVVILTATPEIILAPFCAQHELMLIGTLLEEQNGLYTGKMIGANCIGEEKVRRLKAAFDLERNSIVAAYGDRDSDRPFMALAEKSYFKPFRK